MRWCLTFSCVARCCARSLASVRRSGSNWTDGISRDYDKDHVSQNHARARFLVSEVSVGQRLALDVDTLVLSVVSTREEFIGGGAHNK